MKTVRDEIEERFANVSPGHASPLLLVPDGNPAWALRLSDGRFGVGVPYDGETVVEAFAGSRLHSVRQGQMGSQLPGLLILSSANEEQRNEFSLICADFVDPGNGGWKRQRLTDEPLAWWEGWRALLGNAVHEKNPHAVVGELLIYEHLMKTTDGHVTWSGPSGSSHDICCEYSDAEVKTTLQRYSSVIHITGQFQLQEDSSLDLYFCRLEESKHGISIDDLVDRIARSSRLSRGELNSRLAMLGYEEGSSARRKRYVVLEVRRYQVDDSFPQISARSFVDGVLPAGIQRIAYEVDLGVVPGESVQLADEYYDRIISE